MPKDPTQKRIIIDVKFNKDGTCTHGFKSDFTLLETIGLLQVSALRATEKFSQEETPIKNK